MTLHINFLKTGKIDEEPIDSSTFTKGEKRRLEKYVCGLCEMRLSNINSCGAYEDPCSQSIRNKRIKDCLSSYKPKK